jgi:hypothetical protein
MYIATLQARPIAEARHERRLLGVACKRLLGQDSANKSQKAPSAHAKISPHRSPRLILPYSGIC